MARCRAIAECTEVPGEITRVFLTRPMHRVHALLREWMDAAGMTVQVDAVGNLRGLYPGLRADSPRILIGSHLDTVPNAGAWDGVLGVVLGVALVEELKGARLPFAIEVVGFSEEEGVRFSKPFLGSRALTGTLDETMLGLADKTGVTMREAIANFGLDTSGIAAAEMSPQTLGYLEIHIEQGPVLESEGRKLGVVEAIVGQNRFVVRFVGSANHAGTTPMRLRHDAMAAAAEWIVAVETIATETTGLVATVGKVEVRGGAANVVAGEVTATLDVRHAEDRVRSVALEAIEDAARVAAARRRVEFSWRQTMEQAAVPMSVAWTALLEQAATVADAKPLRMVSGAGHDAMILAQRVEAAMLFVRSPGGVSHNPAETVLVEDVEAALATGVEFLKRLSEEGAYARSQGQEQHA